MKTNSGVMKDVKTTCYTRQRQCDNALDCVDLIEELEAALEVLARRVRYDVCFRYHSPASECKRLRFDSCGMTKNAHICEPCLIGDALRRARKNLKRRKK